MHLKLRNVKLLESRKKIYSCYLNVRPAWQSGHFFMLSGETDSRSIIILRKQMMALIPGQSMNLMMKMIVLKDYLPVTNKPCD